MATINTNIAANIAVNSMTRNGRSMSATMERLSTGLRINSAKDDTAGLAISSKMTSQSRGLKHHREPHSFEQRVQPAVRRSQTDC